MVEISLSGSGEGPGWVTAPGYSTAAKFPRSVTRILSSRESGAEREWKRSHPSRLIDPHPSHPPTDSLPREHGLSRYRRLVGRSPEGGGIQ
jgi:hypothetical protein